MGAKEILEMALKLDESERIAIIEALASSFAQADSEIDRIWADEALRRVRAYDEGRMKTYTLEEVLGDN
ncbi:MAG: addiction module protein [Rhodocyclaceae bacterium]|nr:addiction module protein [Rhodocyclaceae bacterium]